MNILKSQQQHISEITFLASKYKYSHLKNIGKLENGFLVSNYTEDVYRQFVSTSDHFYVASDNHEIVGFILAFSKDRIPPTDWVGNKLKHDEQYFFILVKQVAVSQQHLGKGIAKQLYNHLIRNNRGTHLLAAIVLEPFNQTSIDFHEHIGFKKINEVIAPDKIPRGIWSLITD